MKEVASWLLCIAGFSALSWAVCYVQQMSRSSLKYGALRSRMAQLQDRLDRTTKERDRLQVEIERFERERMNERALQAKEAREAESRMRASRNGRILIDGEMVEAAPTDFPETEWALTERVFL